MSQFHVNPETGEAGPCRATSGNCPFADSDHHYNSPEEARDAYEKEMKNQTLQPGLQRAKTVTPKELKRALEDADVAYNVQNKLSSLKTPTSKWVDSGSSYDLVDGGNTVASLQYTGDAMGRVTIGGETAWKPVTFEESKELYNNARVKARTSRKTPGSAYIDPPRHGFFIRDNSFTESGFMLGRSGYRQIDENVSEDDARWSLEGRTPTGEDTTSQLVHRVEYSEVVPEDYDPEVEKLQGGHIEYSAQTTHWREGQWNGVTSSTSSDYDAVREEAARQKNKFSDSQDAPVWLQNYDPETKTGAVMHVVKRVTLEAPDLDSQRRL